MWFFGLFGTMEQRERTENVSGNALVVAAQALYACLLSMGGRAQPRRPQRVPSL